MNCKKGQGAIEYLLLLGGTVLVGGILIIVLFNFGGNSKETLQSGEKELKSNVGGLREIADYGEKNVIDANESNMPKAKTLTENNTVQNNEKTLNADKPLILIPLIILLLILGMALYLKSKKRN